jgi:hypothetical protein
MREPFFKFPRTPHLSWPLDRTPKDDRVLDPADVRAFLEGDVVVEEKIDGANIGLSLGEDGSVQAQNRGSWIECGAHPQFNPMWSWISRKEPALADALGRDRILFGEWCFAVHSVRYDRLPDWFLGFDIYDRTAGRFWSTQKRNALLDLAGISATTNLNALTRRLESEQSHVGSGPLEGLYLRREDSEWLQARAKLVRPEFLMSIGEHWSSRHMEVNRLEGGQIRV